MHLFHHILLYGACIAATFSDFGEASSPNSVTSSVAADVASMANPILKNRRRGAIMGISENKEADNKRWYTIMSNVIQGDVNDRLQQLKKLPMENQVFLLKMAFAAQDYGFLQAVVEDALKGLSTDFDYKNYKADERFQMIRDLLIPVNQENDDIWNGIRALLPARPEFMNLKSLQFLFDVIEFGDEDSVKIIIGMRELQENLDQMINLAYLGSNPSTIFMLGCVMQGLSIDKIRATDCSKYSQVYQRAFLKSIEKESLVILSVFYKDGNFPLKQPADDFLSAIPLHVQNFINEDSSTMWAKIGFIHCNQRAGIPILTFLFEKLGLEEAKKLFQISNRQIRLRILRAAAAIGDLEIVRYFMNEFIELQALQLQKLDFLSDIIDSLSSLIKGMMFVEATAKDRKTSNIITLYFMAFKGSRHFPKVLKDELKDDYISNEDLKGALLAAFRGRNIFSRKDYKINSDNYDTIIKSLKENILPNKS